jgi:ribose 1,5-bisphosphokinase
MSGVFVCVVGPSGAGKDTLIRYAERRFAGGDDVLFVRRMVTRPSGEFEDHDSLTETDFAEGVAGKAFALAWRAHGHGYAVPLAALAAVRGGAIAVCNLSRAAVGEARSVFGSVVSVLVTAPTEVIAARLAMRGRESIEAIQERLKRQVERSEFSPDHVIANDGAVEAGGERLVGVIEKLRQGRQPAVSTTTGLRAS